MQGTQHTIPDSVSFELLSDVVLEYENPTPAGLSTYSMFDSAKKRIIYQLQDTCKDNFV